MMKVRGIMMGRKCRTRRRCDEGKVRRGGNESEEAQGCQA